MSADRPPTIDPAAAARWRRRPQGVSAWLHEEVARRMTERLGWIVRYPRTWLHWEPVRGGLQAQELVRAHYPQARSVCRVEQPSERALAMRAVRPAWWQPARWRGQVQVVAEPAPESADMLWANMALHAQADPMALMRHWHAALAVDGFLMFSCFGPDTLKELRHVYRGRGWPAPAHDFTDMHDWGDMLVASGFAEPVMDMERIELTFESPERLLQELRELGRNLHPGRFAGLRGRGWHGQLLKALGELAAPSQGGRLALSFEIVYGHAFKPQPRIPVTPETRLSIEEMKRSLTQRKPASLGH